jgi:hypothetical protein
MRLSLGITPKSYFNLAVPNDTDAQAFITAASITDGTQQSAVNQLVLNLKSANIWTKMKAIYPIVGGTASTHKLNLKDSRDLDAAYRLTFATGWTHSSTGMKPNGTSAYANTFLIPVNVFNTTNFNHLSYYSRTNSAFAAGDFVIGSLQASKNIGLIIRDNTNFSGVYSDYDSGTLYRSANISTQTNSLGFFIGSQTGTNIKLFKNNSLQATNTTVKLGAGSGLPAVNTYIGSTNYISPTASAFTDKECAFASIGDGLTDSEASNLYTAVQAYQTTLGRNV